MDALHDFDIALLHWLNANRIPHMDPFFVTVSFTTTMVSLSLLLLLFLGWRVRKSELLKQRLVTLLSVWATSAVLSFILKRIIGRDRPFTTYSFIQKLDAGGSASFPSGHTMEAFAVATAVAMLFTSVRLRLIIFLWACLVGYSRMALGVHYPTDVLGGMVFGISVGFFVVKYFQKKNMKLEEAK